MIPDETDVLIVGAGAAGLTLAIDLARRGVRFALVEQLAKPFGGSKGKGLQPRSLEVFEDLGLLQPVLAEAGLYPPVVNYDGRSELGRIETAARTPTEAEPYPNSLMLPQWRTEAILRDRLQQLGADVAWGVELVGFVAQSGAVRAELRTPAGARALRAKYLVGCDGGRSAVRKALGLGFPGERRPFRMLLADAPVTGLPAGVWARWPRAAGGSSPSVPSSARRCSRSPPRSDWKTRRISAARASKPLCGRAAAGTTSPWASRAGPRCTTPISGWRTPIGATAC
jgi:2-polyprenyl-6-methoxyphenol hydroxylase-like FAD-dependent oxidoreductase